MTDLQEIRLAMFIAVRDYIIANGGELLSLPSFEEFSEQLNSIIGQIQEVRMEQATKRTGNALAKTELKNELAALAFEMSRKLVAHAYLTSNTALKQEADYTITELRNSSDAKFKDSCGIICQQARTFMEDMEQFAVTDESVTSLETKIANFLSAMPAPRAARSSRKMITEKIKNLLDQGDSLLKYKLDVLVDTVCLSNAELYKGYRNSRAMLSEYGSRKLAVMIKVTDAAGMPLSRVETTVEGSPINKKTTDKGNFRVEHLSAGTYIFNFRKGGYKPLSARVIVNNGETTRVDVVMDAIPEYSGVLA